MKRPLKHTSRLSRVKVSGRCGGATRVVFYQESVPSYPCQTGHRAHLRLSASVENVGGVGTLWYLNCETRHQRLDLFPRLRLFSHVKVRV